MNSAVTETSQLRESAAYLLVFYCGYIHNMTRLSQCVYRRVGENLGEVIPSINTLVLTNNNIHELGDIDPLASLTKLEHLR